MSLFTLWTILISMVIYKTTNLVNGKIYVGQDANNNPHYLGSGVILERAVAKYGKPLFKKDILQHCSSSVHLNEQEKWWIKELKATDRSIGYNISTGGDGGDVYHQLSPERQKEMIRKLQEKLKPIHASAEYRALKSRQTREMWKSSTHRERVVKALTGREIKWKDKISAALKSHYETNPHPGISEECRRKTSLAHKGIPDKLLDSNVETQIVQLYQKCGPILIARILTENGFDVSPYMVRRTLKKHGVYQKHQKGIGSTKEKMCSVSRRGERNPMFGKRKDIDF